MNLTFFRYAFNGIILNISGFLVYLLFTFIGIEPKVAMTINYIFFLIIGFFLHKNFSFIGSHINPSKFKFLMVHFSAYLLNLLLLFSMVDLFQFKHQYVQGISVVFVAIYIYLMLNQHVFKIRNKINIKNDSI
tara:strand:- start:196 stop:594 length:399 start_codon:yes stop_codon:yes gene_type:complete